MTQSDPHHEITQLLVAARRRVHRARVAAEIPNAALRALLGVCVLAGTFWSARLMAWLFGTPLPVGWLAFLALAIIAVATAAAVTLGKVIRRVPTDREAAERLDVSVADHNRIATTLAFLERKDTGTFVEAAVEDGLCHARRLADRLPRADTAPNLLPKMKRVALATIGFLVLAAIWGERPGPNGMTSGGLLPAALGERERRPIDKAREPAAESRPAPTAQASRESGAKRQAATRPENSGDATKDEVSAGKTGGTSANQSSSSSESNKGSGESTGESGKRKPEKPKTGAGKGKRPDPKRAVPSKPEKGEEDSSISQGSSGGIAATPVQNNWSQQSQSSETDQDNEDQDDITETDSEQNTQRGGVQPSLKDREAAPSRELGISGDDQGLPGNGRGGPTPPKKSRGTASLVLGVPIPDFIKARLGPGSTKVVHERVDPAAIAGAAAQPTGAAPRSGSEAASESAGKTSAENAAIVRKYLMLLHSADAPL